MPGERGRRRFEPWPLALVGLLALMIGICGTLYAIAASNVDPEVFAPAPAAEAVQSGVAGGAP